MNNKSFSKYLVLALVVGILVVAGGLFIATSAHACGSDDDCDDYNSCTSDLCVWDGENSTFVCSNPSNGSCDPPACEEDYTSCNYDCVFQHYTNCDGHDTVCCDCGCSDGACNSCETPTPTTTTTDTATPTTTTTETATPTSYPTSNPSCTPWYTSCDENYIYQHYTDCPGGRVGSACANGCQIVDGNASCIGATSTPQPGCTPTTTSCNGDFVMQHYEQCNSQNVEFCQSGCVWTSTTSAACYGATPTPSSSSTWTPGPTACNTDAQCWDSDPLTYDYCSNGACYHQSTTGVQGLGCHVSLVEQVGNGVSVNGYATCIGYGCGYVSAALYFDWGDETGGESAGGTGGASVGSSHQYKDPGTYDINISCFFAVNDPANPWSAGANSSLSVTVGATPIPTGQFAPQCGDGLDNDGDGLIDYPDDCGCDSVTDDSESNTGTCSGTPRCSDGSDNDGDGLIDYPEDCGCSSADDDSEANAVSCTSPTPTDTPTPTDSGEPTPTESTAPNYVPSVSDVHVTEPDYCSSGPVAYVSWIYSDPDSDPQSAYQIQIDDVPSFGSPVFNTGKLEGTTTSYITSSIAFDTTYYARVRVWDSHNAGSSWKTMTLCTGPGCASSQLSWTSPVHAYPGYVNFTWTPTTPIVNQEITFSRDTTVCYGANNIPAPCAAFTWNFGDGTSVVSTNTDTQMHAYSSLGVYQVQFSARDADGFICPDGAPLTKPVSIQGKLPEWKEVLPR